VHRPCAVGRRMREKGHCCRRVEIRGVRIEHGSSMSCQVTQFLGDRYIGNVPIGHLDTGTTVLRTGTYRGDIDAAAQADAKRRALLVELRAGLVRGLLRRT